MLRFMGSQSTVSSLRHRSTSTCTGACTGFSPACASTLHLFCIGWADLGPSSEQTWAVTLPPPCIVRKDPRVPHTARRGVRETQVQSLDQEDSPGEGNGNPLQYSCLENPMDGTLATRVET